MLYSVRHRTTYRYEAPVTLSHHAAHLRPLDRHQQTCRAHQLMIEPLPTSIEESSDYFGNGITVFSITGPHQSLIVEAMSEVEMRPATLDPSAGRIAWERIADEARSPHDAVALAAAEFAVASPAADVTPLVKSFAAPSFVPGRPLVEATLDLAHRIHRDFAFDPHATTISTPTDEVLRLKRGVCQDFAHLMIAGCRAHGVPARYVSGYLETDPPAGGKRLVGADASHAWVAVHAGAGIWLEIDPTNDRLAGTSHVAVAQGRDYGDVSPLRGVILGGGDHVIEVAVDVERLLI
ncbi:MAG TPA: transglutaminase family protein [Aliidongia sp.]|uniref:transglutaminase family protein n=1 Tax=Aliidongia sp. TaxID=1914230 RepID=UPI002DDCC268|nr:transglutaminase family protein [Aliidongia sp.]HEV2678828.1 transglutaminase family protein [Aliidongia sp.]